MPLHRDFLRPWTAAVAIATLLGLSSVGLIYFGMMIVGKPLTLRHALLAGLPDWYFWAALTPVVFWLGRRFRVERRHRARAALVHLGAGVLVALTELTVVATFNHFFYSSPYNPPMTYWVELRTTVLRYFHFAFIIYWLIVTAAHAFGFHQESRRREAEEAALRLANAELEARLAIRCDVDPSVLDDLVPAMILQPLVENAIRHGVQAAPVGTVRVSARPEGDALVLEVRDDGPGLAGGTAGRGRPAPRARVGLTNTRARLEQLYGPAHAFTLRDAADGGAVATLRIPRRPAAGAPAGAGG